MVTNDNSDWLAADTKFGHRLLGPRAVYAVGSETACGRPHFIVATNVTSIGTEPDCVCIGLHRDWETTSNISRTGRFTLTLFGRELLDAAWTLGWKYSGANIPDGKDPMKIASLDSLSLIDAYPPIVELGLTALACDVVRVIDDISDHVVYIAIVTSAWARSEAVDDDWILDTARHHALMQISGRHFAESWPSGRPANRRSSWKSD